jgi:hypothetical protein
MRIKATIVKNNKVVGRSTVDTASGDAKAFKAVMEDARQQAKAREVAIHSRRNSYRKKI